MGQPFSRARTLALFAAAFGGTFTRAGAQQTTTLRIGTSTADSYAEPFFGADGGFFARAGINPQITIMNNGNELAQAIAGNALDIAIADPINVAHAHQAGVPFAFFAGSGLYLSSAPTTVMVVAKSSTMQTAKDLEGKTVAVPGLASITALGARQWLRKQNVDLTKISFVEVPYATVGAALVRGTVAASMLSEPFITTNRNDLRPFAKCFDAIGTSFYINSWFAPRAWLLQNADLAHRLTATIYQTAGWANTHHAETAPMVSKYLKLEEKTAQDMTRVRFGTGMEPGLIQPVLDAAASDGEIKPVKAQDLIARV